MKSANNDLYGAAVSLGEGQSFHVENNRLLIECIKDKDVYDSTIFLIKPETAKMYARTGYIRQIGDDVKSDYPFIIGSKVHYLPYEGVDLDLDGKDMKILIPENLLAVEN